MSDELTPNSFAVGDPARIRAAQVPPGGDSVAALCQQVYDDLDQVAAQCATDIRRAIDAYAGSAVSDEDLHQSVVRNMDLLLIALAENRPPRLAEINVLRDLGALRANQGMSISHLNEAFHIGYRHVWEQLVDRSAASDDATRSRLLGAATTMWAWTHYTGDALGSSHATVTHDLAVRAAATRYRFLDLLTSGSIESEELALLGRSLGFDLEGRFCAVVYRCTTPVTDDATGLQRSLGLLAGLHQVVARGRVITVLSQGGSVTDVDDAIRDGLGDDEAAGGTGRDRASLAGARLSLGDANRAAALATPGTTVHFDDEWIWAVLRDEQERLDDVIATGRMIVTENPDVAETVRCFAECGFSPARTAKQLFVHANTVSYRLKRWHEMTGWDARTFDGLARSMACIRLTLND